ncbi:MAG: T9SS type A sorting domain-containing protein [Bacteroidetes bacterium]|nr:T9SS type A sorting domain-containing protein [Bacteroidota bacterium]
MVPIVKALQELDIRNNELQLQNMELKRELELIRVGLNLEEKKLSTASFLYQNFPNPFNTETIIKYVVGSNTVKVFLKINNLKGEEVFYSVIEKPGSGEVKIDAGVLSPGMYVFSLVVDTKIADSKVMIVEE